MDCVTCRMYVYTWYTWKKSASHTVPLFDNDGTVSLADFLNRECACMYVYTCIRGRFQLVSACMYGVCMYVLGSVHVCMYIHTCMYVYTCIRGRFQLVTQCRR